MSYIERKQREQRQQEIKNMSLQQVTLAHTIRAEQTKQECSEKNNKIKMLEKQEMALVDQLKNTVMQQQKAL